MHMYSLVLIMTHTYYSSATITWSSDLKEVAVNKFRSSTGPRVPIPASILGTFYLFFVPALLEYIVQQTNLYASQCMGADAFAAWDKITVPELTAYFGFLILMGLVPLPALADYWSKDEVFHYKPIASKISRDRFFELGRYLHFADNSTLAPPGSAEYNKIGKVQPLVDSLLEAFQSVYNPQRDTSVDEAMIRFKGKSTLKQYMPNKPVKRGIKVWVLADPSNGCHALKFTQAKR